jgi:hypothetical protein
MPATVLNATDSAPTAAMAGEWNGPLTRSRMICRARL